MDIHTVQKKLGYGMTSALRPLGERFDQRGGIALSAGTAIEDDKLFGHGIPSSLKFFRQSSRLLAAVCFFNVTDIQNARNKNLPNHLPFH